jgi:hypothetical protein
MLDPNKTLDTILSTARQGKESAENGDAGDAYNALDSIEGSIEWLLCTHKLIAIEKGVGGE